MTETRLIDLYDEVKGRLSLAAMPQSAVQAKWLISQLLRMSFYEPQTHPQKEIDETDRQRVLEGVKRLLKGEPLEYIAGYTQFDGLELKVSPSVLIPRPETEELAYLVAKKVKSRAFSSTSYLPFQALDLATGSGCLALSLAKRLPSWHWHASDLSEEALRVAKENAACLAIAVEFRQGSWIEPWKDKKFDLVVSNPPYIGWEEKELIAPSAWQYEPHLALLDGEDGLSVYRLLAKQLKGILNPKSLVALEIGYRQGEEIKAVFRNEGWGEGEVERDLSGHPRFFFITWQGAEE